MATAASLTSDEREYFERYIRPVLIQNCYTCHGEDPNSIKGGFNLTHRDGIQKGNNLIPGAPEQSRIVQALHYDNPDLQMPPSGRLPDTIIQQIEHWISMGAPDPRDEPFTPGDVTQEDLWAETLEQRKSWWSFQPIHARTLPEPSSPWSDNPVDAFIKQALDEAEIAPSPLAEPHTILRRLSYILTGLPPTLKELDAFEAIAKDDLQLAVESTTDKLLASSAFGERWARHWMDWMRYAETHGSEGDPAIPNAWRYRDYLIRALNADVPYDDLVREHLAGDLLPKPRINDDLGIIESVLGIAQYRFVLHGFAPTDPLDEQVRFTDNQIDTITKAFLGTTVSCARCHNHKFDPVSQEDFYALFGVMASTRPAERVIDTPERLNLHKDALADLKEELRDALATQWTADSDAIAAQLLNPDTPWKEAIDKADTPFKPLHIWNKLSTLDDEAFDQGWSEIHQQWERSVESLLQRQQAAYPVQWNLSGTDWSTWAHHGNGVSTSSADAGAFHVLPNGNQIVHGIYPAGIYTHLLSNKHSGVISSPIFDVNKSNVYMRVIGNQNAVARYVIRNYPRDGTVYPVLRMNDSTWRWQQWSLDYWDGETAYLEVSTGPDQAVLADRNATRSWFGITEAIVVPKGKPAPKDEMAEFLSPLFYEAASPRNVEDLGHTYQRSIQKVIQAWHSGTMRDDEARFLNAFVQQGLLSNTTDGNETLESLVKAYRDLEKEVPVPTRAPGVIEHEPFNQPLFARGNHKQPKEEVPRRFLEALDKRPFPENNAGRLALAERIVAKDNPLTARVIANRLWHHTFGKGIVATPDDFGVMGSPPSHPELLDFLAHEMKQQDWSIKKLLRLLVTSKTFQRSAIPNEAATNSDPDNALLSHATIRRLEAEAIRDSLLLIAGNLDTKAPSGSTNGQSNKRSIYVNVIRNNLDPFLTTFDAPVPVNTKGRRDETNVASHSLTFLNDPFVKKQAQALSKNTSHRLSATRLNTMFRTTLGRHPSSEETQILEAYITKAEERPDGVEYDTTLANEINATEQLCSDLKTKMDTMMDEAIAKDTALAAMSRTQLRNNVAPDDMEQFRNARNKLRELKKRATPQPWIELAQSILSLKEFIYLQ